MKILIADDSPANRKLLKHMVRQRGHKAIEAADGKIALEKARTHSPDIVISDAVMPVMDGYQLLRELKADKDLRRIPFILFSALYGSSQDRKLAESLGASAFLTKSMRLDDMWGHIESVIRNPHPHSNSGQKTAVSSKGFQDDHIRIVVSKLKEKVQQLENEIAERTKAEKALKKSEERFRKLVESTTDYLYTVSIKNGHPASTTHGPGCVAVTGYEAEEYNADPGLWVRMIPDEERNAVLDRISKIVASECPPAIEHRIVHKDGRVRWVRNTVVPRFNEKGKLIAYDGLIADITERKELDIKIRNAATEWTVTFDSMADGVSVHGPDHTILRVNETLCRILGKSRNELLGKKCYHLFHCTDKPISDCPLSKSLQTGSKEDLERFEPALAGGRWVAISASPVVDEKGEITKIIHVVRDITEHKQAEANLQRMYRRNELILNCAGEGIYGIDRDGKVTFANPAATEMLGYPPETLKGRDSHEVWHHSHPDGTPYPKEACQVHAAINESLTKQVREDIYWRADGTSFPIAYVATPIIEEGSSIGAVVVFKDITDRKTKEEQLQRQLRHMAALHGIDLAITSSLDLNVMLGVVLDKVSTELNIDAADILLFNPHLQTLEYAAGRGFRTQALRHTHLRIGECFAGKAALERRIVTISDMIKTPGEFVRAKLLADEEFVTYHAAPLIAKGQVKGVLEVFHRTVFDANDDWLEFLQTIATQAAMAIDNSSLLDELQKSHTELTQAYETTLEGWSRAMDLRDKETEGHCRRVAEMALRMARAMGVSSADQAHLYRGALLHDIGKIGVPDAILLKPDKLTEEEWKIMKRHTTHAYELLLPIPFLRPAIDIPYCHHERWDGKGYPQGLKGEEIPLGARIFSVVDVWDALRSNRPYRSAWPEEKVRGYIRSLAGTHFDPKVAEIFLAMEW